MPDLQKIPFDAFKFYEEAAEKAKGHAWSQSTWILGFSAAVLAFSLKLYTEHPDVRGLVFMEWLAALAGLGLCGYLVFVLSELGKHIRNYWTNANKIAASDDALVPFIGQEEAERARLVGYRAGFPRFITRLQMAPSMFALAHLVWAVYATALSCR